MVAAFFLKQNLSWNKDSNTVCLVRNIEVWWWCLFGWLVVFFVLNFIQKYTVAKQNKIQSISFTLVLKYLISAELKLV